MNNLEKYFKQNQAFFNQDEPDKDHFEKFTEKLDQTKPKNNIFKINTFFKYAAIFIVFIGFVGILIHSIQPKEDTEIALCDEELEMVEQYYQSLSLEKLLQLDKAVQEGKITPKDQKDILKKLQELDNEKQKLKLKLTAMNCDTRLRSAFINNNMISVNLLTSVLESLEKYEI